VIRARLYDGRTSGARTAELQVAGSGTLAILSIHSGDTSASVPLAAVGLGERVGDTPRLLQLPDGGSLEVLDNAAFDAALEAAGLTTREAPIRRLEGRWRYAFFALIATAIGSVAFVRYGIPVLAERAVRFIPPRVDAYVGVDSLELLDRAEFHPSRLSPDRQAQLRRLFGEVTAGASADSAHYRLEIRDGGSLGANAFALPSGIVVLTDQLANLAASDDELRGVFAHEVGHLVNRHAMRMLVQGSATALLVVGVFGDVSGVTSLATTAPTVLVSAAYSRDFEREADTFAFRWMAANRLDPARLGDLLERLAREHGPDHGGFLASHPDLRERVQALRAPPAR